MHFRTERDPLGESAVPADAYYGIQTARAVANFPISGLRAPADLVTATILVKKAAAQANMALDRLDARVGDAIVRAADEVLGGALRDQFIVDVYQAGAGTSHNMNANEVLANRAAEILGGARGEYTVVHPNDHVNMGQSTNDVFPTATRLALLLGHAALVESARALSASFARKAEAFESILKVGRTHLQDAVPMTLGQEFGGYAACLARGADEVDHAAGGLDELNLGATAVGTGLNAGEEYTSQAIKNLARATGLRLKPAANRFRVTQSMGDVLGYSGAMRRLAVELGKVAADLRLLSMGPRAGIAEIVLPAVQPGSSIMPGKVNPSVPEMVNQVCYQVMGCDVTIAAAAEAGQLELNVMMPVIAWNALHMATILRESMKALRVRCVDGIEADPDRCRELLDRSTAVATALSPYIGYAKTAEIAKEAVKTGRSIREIVLERGLMDARRLDEVLSAENMTRPGIAGEVKKIVRVLTLAGAVSLGLCAVCLVPLQAQNVAPAGRQGRLFPPENLGLLEAPDRDAWQKPEQIMDALGVAEGSVVADIGAGAGWFTIQLARRVGPNGTVYAQDVQRQMLEAIRRRVAREGLQNVQTRLGAGSAPNLPTRALDAVLVVDVYPEVEGVDRVSLLRNLAAALKPGGRLGIVNYKPGNGGPGPAPDEGVRIESASVEQDALVAGLRVLTRQTLPYQYLLVLGR